jgi:sterol desaturase/sphingolipid hydroxylase (fatty acid hydroxylase superfamily)
MFLPLFLFTSSTSSINDDNKIQTISLELSIATFPSFFEMTVAMAFDYFAAQKVDIAVIETGLGGRLDSTNVIDPEVALITNIGLDHTDILGDTLEKIAAEKAGIMKKNNTYRLNDSINSLNLGMISTLNKLIFINIGGLVFVNIEQDFALFTIDLTSVVHWIIAILVYDFCYYWFHRISHERQLFWGGHVVHHQSEELNLTTVFRVSFLAVMYRATFFVWMAFAGFDVFTIVSTGVFLGLYQLFTHSRLIGKLGFIEKFMTTPSHHRVHHASNEKYLDQNYGHIFIIWDKLFGTFMEEQEEPKYGITSGYKRSNAYNAIFSYWGELFSLAKIGRASCRERVY